MYFWLLLTEDFQLGSEGKFVIIPAIHRAGVQACVIVGYIANFQSTIA